jgi:hypothetical protein
MGVMAACPVFGRNQIMVRIVNAVLIAPAADQQIAGRCCAAVFEAMSEGHSGRPADDIAWAVADMLLILPMLGINAFTPPKQEDPSDQVQPVGSENDKFDTIVVPAREEGFKQRFLNENCWFAVRINAKHISKLKFIAAYQVAPVAAITHIAEVDAILPYNDTGKYMIKFKGPATAIVPIPRPENSEVNMQSSRYALREKLLAAKNLDEVWA